MRVTNFSVKREGDAVRFCADFVFARPIGGKRAQVFFWLQWLFFFVFRPSHTIRFGYQVRQRIWFSIPNTVAVTANLADAFFIIAVPLAIAVQEPLVFDTAVSAELVSQLDQLHTYYHEVAPKKIIVSVDSKQTHKKKPTAIGQFFTLGVDSFYSLLQKKSHARTAKPTLIYVDGYDVPFYEKLFLKYIHKRIRTVARAASYQSVFVETNLRTVSDKIIGWGRYHVTGLVAVGHLLNIGTVRISGESFDAQDWGLRFGVDKLYTTQQRSIKLVAHAVPRLDKIKRLLASSLRQLFINNVRVCWENVRWAAIPYNCSVCQKCLKTQLSLLALGIKHPPTFDPISAKDIEKIQLVAHVQPEWHELLSAIQNNAQLPPDISSAIAKVLHKPVRR